MPEGCNPGKWPEYVPSTKWTLDASQLADADDIVFSVPISGSKLTRELYPYVSAPNLVQLSSAHDMHPEDTVELSWQWVAKQFERDALFVLVGVFVAIGATMFLEAVRPFAERMAAHQSDGTAPERHSVNKRPHAKTPHSS